MTVNGDSTLKGILVAGGVAFVCALVVSLAAVNLRPLQDANREAERQARVLTIIQGIPGLGHLGDAPFFVLNADGLWLDGETSALARMADLWDDDRMDGLLLLHDPQTAFGYDGVGDFMVDIEGRLSRRQETDTNAQVFTGVQLLHPRLFEGAPGGAYSLNVLYDRALAAGRLFGTTASGEWHHVGTMDALAESDAHIRERDQRP